MSRPSRARLCPDCSGSGSRLNDRGVPVLCRCMYAAAGSPARTAYPIGESLRECMDAEERRDDALWRGFCAGLLAASIVWAAVVVWLGPWWAA